jgi:mannosyltransferase OCH1-like enzyme
MESVQKFLPEWDIKIWKESDFKTNQIPYLDLTLNLNKFAFASDYARMLLIYNEGGIYLDIDCILIRNFEEEIADSTVFFAYEDKEYLASGIGFGAIPFSPVIRGIMEFYESQVNFINDKYNFQSAPVNETKYLNAIGLEYNSVKTVINGVTVFPEEYFSPINYKTGKVKITSNTCSIHNFESSWTTSTTRKLTYIRWLLNRRLGFIGNSVYLIIELFYNLSAKIYDYIKREF